MSGPPRAIGFYDPRTYDWGIGSSGSRAQRRRFYVARTAHPDARVLELGCGTGDISLAIASRGSRVVGLDVSPEMVAAARDKARGSGCSSVAWVQGRMEAFAFRASFTSVVVPYHALFHVLGRGTLGELLTRAYEHLEPGGMFLADIFTRRPDAPTQRKATTATVTPDGIYHVTEHECFEPATGRLHTLFTYRLEDPQIGGTVDGWTRHLDYLVTEPRALEDQLRHAGFTAIASFAAFDPGRGVTAGEDAVLSGFRPTRR